MLEVVDYNPRQEKVLRKTQRTACIADLNLGLKDWI